MCACHSSRLCSQAFLAAAVETWDKKRDEFPLYASESHDEPAYGLFSAMTEETH